MSRYRYQEIKHGMCSAFWSHNCQRPATHQLVEWGRPQTESAYCEAHARQFAEELNEREPAEAHR